MKISERIDRTIDIARTTAELVVDDSSVTARIKIVLRLTPRPRVIIELISQEVSMTRQPRLEPRTEYKQDIT